MLLRRTNGSLGWVLVALGFVLGLQGVTTPASAINIIVRYDDTINTDPNSAKIKQIIEEIVVAYNEGFTGDITIPIEFTTTCPGTCLQCLAESSTLHYDNLPYSAIRDALAERVCGSVANADAGCLNPTPDASARDIQTFRSGMWPSGSSNPINQDTSLMINVANARVLGGAEVHRDPSGVEYMVMCNNENDSWCTAGTGHFQTERFINFVNSRADSIINFNLPCFHEFGGSNGHLEDALDHELAEALGLGSGCQAINPPDSCGPIPRMQDMFRFYGAHDSVTPRPSYKVTDKHWVYFSTDNGQSPVLGSGLGPYFNTNAGEHCVGGDYGDWYSCPGRPLVARDQDAFQYGDPSVGGIAWTALDVQGYTLANALTHEGGEVLSSVQPPLSAAQVEHAASHFQIRAKRSDARCRLGQAVRALRNLDAGDVTRCDRRFKRTVRKLARSVGEFPGYGEIGYHMNHNDQWVQSIYDSLGTEPRGANAICAKRVLRAVSRHLRCEGSAQLMELRRDAGKGSRVRDRCDRRFTRKLNLLAEYPEPKACTALIDAVEVIEASRNGFRGEIVD